PPTALVVVRRDGVPEPIRLTLALAPYEPETVFGFARTVDGTWNLFPNPDAKIGYIRVGPMDTGAGEAFHRLLEQLEAEKAAGLVLDLRWNPGGYVTPAYQIAGAFLKPDQLITKLKYHRAERPREPDPYPPPAEGREWALALPLAVLVNAETTGGGEMIAAALQDHKRA